VVADTRAANGAGRDAVRAQQARAQQAAPLRQLNQPRPAAVEAGDDGTPLTVERRAVEAVLETWRIEDEWWRAQPVSRTYWRLQLEDVRSVDVYYDRLRKRWYRQAYSR
jgi:hypothetical protein